MKKKIKTLATTLLLTAAIAGAIYGLKSASIATGFAAKITCSAYFIAGRSLEHIRAQDLYAVNFTRIHIDDSAMTVSASVYGMARAIALFRPGFGCTLVKGTKIANLKDQQFPLKRQTVPFEFPFAPTDKYFNQQQLTAAVNEIFVHHDSDTLQTRAVLVIKDGELVFERYAEGFNKNTPLIGWSMTKSVTNALVGLRVLDQTLSLQRPLNLIEWLNDERNNITLDNLLHMSSGLEFDENYGTLSDVNKMLFKSYSAADYALQSPLSNPPGSLFYYSSGTSNIVQEVIKRTFPSLAEYQSYPYQRLFDVIGMASAIIEPDSSGTYVGSSFMYATARDWAKFGQLYLQDGIWQGQRLLPENWVAYSAQVTKPSNGTYAAHFWVNHNREKFPRDAFVARGYEGQFITIIPSHNMVIVRLGCTYGQVFDNEGLVISVLDSLLTGDASAH